MMNIHARIQIMESRLKMAGLRGYEFVITLNREDFLEIQESVGQNQAGIIESYRGMEVQIGRFTSIGIKI